VAACLLNHCGENGPGHRSSRNPNPSKTTGTHVLLEACRMVPSIRRVINVSTDEVYGETSLGAAEGTPPLRHSMPFLDIYQASSLFQ